MIHQATDDPESKMQFTTRMVSLVALLFSLTGAFSVLGQARRHRHDIALRLKASIKCSQRSREGVLCAPPVTLLTDPNDTKSQNTVTVQVTIDELGKVTSARAISGNPKWHRFVLEDARRRKFAPTVLSGVPVKVLGVIEYHIEGPPKVSSEDFQLLSGAPWAGTLTYLDYRANKKVSIPSNLTVSPAPNDKQSWIFEYQYPDEPKANGKEGVTIGKDGQIINAETVTNRTKLDGGAVQIVTEKKGQDNDREALFRYTYLLSATSFSIKKEVRYEGESKFFERNEYSWKR